MPEKLIQFGLDHNIAFAFWRFPGKGIKGVFSHRAVPLRENQAPDGHGFLVAPFMAEDDLRAYFIPATKTYPEIFGTEALETLTQYPANEKRLPHITTKDDYLEAFSQLKAAIDSGVTEKIVLSRTRESQYINRETAGKIFAELEETYPSAMAYVFNIPQRGCWMGATPEILLSKHAGHYKTVSVAGTRTAGSPEKWTEKEVHEQAVVSAFIENILRSFNIKNFNRKGPENFHAGNVVHLKTTYQIPSSQMADKAFALAGALHPTPAVCGLPRNKARGLIRKTEKHNREFYSGYLGEVDTGKQEVNLFVNLRCMQVFKDRAVLYAGGGLTKGSEVEKEWEETQEKTRTLLNVAEKLE